MTAIECYMHGISVLAFDDSGGLKEIIDSIEPMNVFKSEEDLVHQLIHYYKNPEKIITNKKKLKNHAHRFFTINEMSKNYHSVYKYLKT